MLQERRGQVCYYSLAFISAIVDCPLPYRRPVSTHSFQLVYGFRAFDFSDHSSSVVTPERSGERIYV